MPFEPVRRLWNAIFAPVPGNHAGAVLSPSVVVAAVRAVGLRPAASIVKILRMPPAAGFRANATRRPFGEIVGCSSMLAPGSVAVPVSCRRPVPPGLITQMRPARTKATVPVRLTTVYVRAMASVGFDGADALREESDAILERLGVVSVPKVPLP